MDFEVSKGILLHWQRWFANMRVFNRPYVSRSVHIWRRHCRRNFIELYNGEFYENIWQKFRFYLKSHKKRTFNLRFAHIPEIICNATQK